MSIQLGLGKALEEACMCVCLKDELHRKLLNNLLKVKQLVNVPGGIQTHAFVHILCLREMDE